MCWQSSATYIALWQFLAVQCNIHCFVAVSGIGAFCSDRPPRWPSDRASALRVEGPGFKSRLWQDFFGVESYQ